MKKTEVFVPGHITGFFQACDKSDDPLLKGSRNCGPCIEDGVHTIVKVKQSDSQELQVFFDGRKETAKTSRTAAKEVLKEIEGSFSVNIRHELQAPLGAGYGMSGAGALGVVLGIIDALDMDLSREDAVSLAHKSEVVNGSGLGDVGPQALGGLVIGVEPGAPPYGKWNKIEVSRDLEVVYGTEGPLSTNDLLKDRKFRAKTKRLGHIALRDLLKDSTVGNFMRISNKFTNDLGIFDEEFTDVLNGISNESSMGAGAVMLGRAIFAFCESSESDSLVNIFEEYFDPGTVRVCSLDLKGARLLD